MSEEDLQLLITLDDPRNAQECDTFYGREAEEWEDWFKAEREFRRGLVGPPERLPFSSVGAGRVTN
jgi:hypothetical protein